MNWINEKIAYWEIVYRETKHSVAKKKAKQQLKMLKELKKDFDDALPLLESIEMINDIARTALEK